MSVRDCPFIDDYISENKLIVDGEEIKMKRGKKIKSVELLDDRRFVKVYIQSDEVLASLKNSTKIVFEYIFKTLQSSDSYNAMEIEFSYRDYVIFNKRRGIENPVSEKSFYNARAELIKNRIIALKDGTTYWYNFNYFFNGDRFSVVKEYILNNGKKPDVFTACEAVLPIKVKKDVNHSLNRELEDQKLRELSDEQCSKVPVEILKKLNKDVYAKHSPIWWAILSAQVKKNKFPSVR